MSTPPSPASAISYTSDNNGDLTARGSDSFGWDFEDRMVHVTLTDGTAVAHTYDVDGNRVQTKVTTPLVHAIVSDWGTWQTGVPPS